MKSCVDTRTRTTIVSTHTNVLLHEFVCIGPLAEVVIAAPTTESVDNGLVVVVSAIDGTPSKNPVNKPVQTVLLIASSIARQVVLQQELLSFINGVAKVVLSPTTAEAVQLTLLPDDPTTGVDFASQAQVTMTAGAVTKLVYQPIADFVVGSTTSVVVEAQDRHSNVNLTYAGTVETFSANADISGLGSLGFIAGVARGPIGSARSQSSPIDSSLLTLLPQEGLDTSSTTHVNIFPGESNSTFLRSQDPKKLLI